MPYAKKTIKRSTKNRFPNKNKNKPNRRVQQQQKQFKPYQVTRQQLLKSLQFYSLTKEQQMEYVILNRCGYNLDIEPSRQAWVDLEHQLLYAASGSAQGTTSLTTPRDVSEASDA